MPRSATSSSGPTPPATIPAAPTLVAGEAGIDRIDLGVIPAGGSTAFSLLLTPGAARPLTIVGSASDAGSTLADANPADNTVTTSLTTAPAPATGIIATPSTVELDFATALTRAQAQDLSHYQLTTTAGATVRVRSASYDARQHRVTLHLTRALPKATTSTRLAIAGLGNSGGITNLSLARRTTRRR